MNHTLKDRLLQFTTFLQRELFVCQEAEMIELTRKLQEVIKILEFVEIERYVPSYHGCVGRHGKYRGLHRICSAGTHKTFSASKTSNNIISNKACKTGISLLASFTLLVYHFYSIFFLLAIARLDSYL